MTTYVFKTGKPRNPAEGVTNLIKYLPRERNPFFPSQVRRENLVDADLKSVWDTGRGKAGPANPYSGYYTKGKTYTRHLHDKMTLTPRSELERFMPNVDLGPKARVTPVSLLAARDGHRVTHDLLHSYDPYVAGRSRIDHDKISKEDPQRNGLHPRALGSRALIFRWLRRAPLDQEKKYFTRYVVPASADHEYEGVEAEQALVADVVRLAEAGKLRAACEVYRRMVFVPPVIVYRALLNACVAQGMLGDAISIFEDGHRVMRVRDYVCFRALLRTAIAANNAPRVMWVHDQAMGNTYQNVHLGARIENVHLGRLQSMALAYLLDSGHTEEARTVYRELARRGLTSLDIEEDAGLQLRERLLKGEKVALPTAAAMRSSVQAAVDATAAAKLVAPVWRGRRGAHEVALDGRRAAPSEEEAASSLEALQRAYRDVDVGFVLRAARLEDVSTTAAGASVDLLAAEAMHPRYIDRCLAWLDALSDRPAIVGDALPYLRKTKPAGGAVGPNVRVVSPTEGEESQGGGRLRPGRLLASEDGYSFWYDPSGKTRTVVESYPSFNADSAARTYLVRQPVHKPVPIALEAEMGRRSRTAAADKMLEAGTPPRRRRRVHGSVHDAGAKTSTFGAAFSLGGSTTTTTTSSSSSSSPTTTTTTTAAAQKAVREGSVLTSDAPVSAIPTDMFK